MKPAHIILLLAVNLVWGVNFVAVEWAVRELPPMVANSLRFFAAGLVLAPWLKRVPARMRAVLLVAFTLGVLHFGMVFIGMSLAGDVSAVAIAAQLNVPFATLLAVFVLGEKIGWKRVAGIALSFLGVLVMSFDPRVFGYLLGLSFVVLSAFMYAVSAVMLRQLKDVKALTIQAWVALAGVLGSLLFSFAFEEGQLAAISVASWTAFAGVLYSGLMSSIFGHGSMTYLLSKYEVSVVTPYLLTMPVFALAASALILGEVMTGRMWAGALITLAGVAVITLRNARRAGEQAEKTEKAEA